MVVKIAGVLNLGFSLSLRFRWITLPYAYFASPMPGH